ncbi:MAG: serine/threonine protein kinase [Acidobacteria bacterium]|nr:serine/threonine protein kinase [Acidobacteriota bacterium]
MPEVIDGRYQVRRLLGRGGQGSVYLAHDPNLDIEVAVKVLTGDAITPEFLERFAVEARTAARIDHPHVVRVFDFEPSYPYIVMEYCDGGDLTRVIKSRGRTPLADALRLTVKLCRGLGAAHEHAPPILHRDLKPGNVLFKKGVPKIGDFGLAKTLGTSGGLTASRGIMGTIRYMSPEQCFDPSRVDHRTDLWALGVILYEMLSWKRPFDDPNDSFVQIAMKIRFEPPAQLPFEVPAPVASILQRALARAPEDRFASAREMGDAIEAALDQLADAATSLFPPPGQRTELDDAAAECAQLLEAGKPEQAHAVTRHMAELAPHDSLTRYWRLSAEPRTGSRPAGASAAGAGDSVRSLIDRGAFRDARRQIGELLRTDADDVSAQALLSSLREKERQVREALNAAYARADEARGRGDLGQVLAIWQEFHESYEDVPEGAAELAVAARELELELAAAQAPASAAPSPIAGPAAPALDVARAAEAVEEAAASLERGAVLGALVAAAAAVPSAERTAELDEAFRAGAGALDSGESADVVLGRLRTALADAQRTADGRRSRCASLRRELAAAGAQPGAPGGDVDLDAEERLAEELRAARVAAAWSRGAPALAQVDARAGAGTLPAGIAERAEELRRAALAGDVDRAGALAAELRKPLEAAPRASAPPARPLGAAQRKFNQRYHPAALAAWDRAWRELSAEKDPARRAALGQRVRAARAALLPARRAWPFWAVTAALALAVLAAGTFLRPGAAPPPADYAVGLVAPDEQVDVVAATRDGRDYPALRGAVTRRVVRLPAGRYALELAGGRRLQFEVPAVRSVVLYGTLPDFQGELDRAALAAGARP